MLLPCGSALNCIETPQEIKFLSPIRVLLFCVASIQLCGTPTVCLKSQQKGCAHNNIRLTMWWLESILLNFAKLLSTFSSWRGSKIWYFGLHIVLFLSELLNLSSSLFFSLFAIYRFCLDAKYIIFFYSSSAFPAHPAFAVRSFYRSCFF